MTMTDKPVYTQLQPGRIQTIQLTVIKCYCCPVVAELPKKRGLNFNLNAVNKGWQRSPAKDWYCPACRSKIIFPQVASKRGYSSRRKQEIYTDG